MHRTMRFSDVQSTISAHSFRRLGQEMGQQRSPLLQAQNESAVIKEKSFSTVSERSCKLSLFFTVIIQNTISKNQIKKFKTGFIMDKATFWCYDYHVLVYAHYMRHY